jgi:hypothetical protein
MVCGQIHAPATLPNYVHMHVMNKALRRQPAILETCGRRSQYFLNEALFTLPSVDVCRNV